MFPGGAGTTEEILYLLGILLDPENAQQPMPVVLTGPKGSSAYFDRIAQFLEGTVGRAALARLRIVPGDPAEAARQMSHALEDVREHRRRANDSYNFNWLLRIRPDFLLPFEVTHDSMRALDLHREQPPYQLAANLRRAFSGIVTGNVKDHGIKDIEAHGPYELSGDPGVMRLLDDLLRAFVAQGRMKLPGSEYKPCYRLVA